MRVDRPGCDRYLQLLAELMDRYGIRLTEPAPGEDLVLLEDEVGRLSFRLSGSMGGARTRATVVVREELEPIGEDDLYQTSRYAYELVDRQRDYRRAFHLHDADWFRREFMVVVHEHCERPIGRPVCDHHAGEPMRDGFAGLAAIIGAWLAEPVECGDLPCLD